MLISDKSDEYLESRCDQLKFFLVLIFGILPQKELYNEKILKIDFIINFPPLFFASEVKNAKKVTLTKNAKKNSVVYDAAIFVGIFYFDWYQVSKLGNLFSFSGIVHFLSKDI